MSNEQKKTRAPVIRQNAEEYLLMSLVAFGVTVVFIRVFLHFTNYPQIGNDVLHIAHALWGGLLLFIAVLLPISMNNRWAIKTSALLSGIGIGLFIDEVGKFITQTNDYFFPPALSLIYGFFLLNVLVYLYFRRPRREEPRKAMYHTLEGLQDVLDGDFDTEEASQIEAHLAVARQSGRKEIASLADIIGAYLKKEEQQLPPAKPGLWKRIVRWIDTLGPRVGHKNHRIIISVLLILWVVYVISYVALMIWGSADIDIQVLQWRGVLIVLQSVIGGLTIVAIINWLTGYEERGLNYAIWGVLLSLVTLQLLYFYISQVLAISSALLQFLFLQIMFTYRRWHLLSGTSQNGPE